MHLTLLSVGKMRASPELTLVEIYVDRFRKSGAALGLRSLSLVEVASGGGKDAEGARILSALPAQSEVLRLDEHGKQWRSAKLAQDLARRRDQGVGHLTFIIGGAEGYSQAVIEACPHTLGLGVQTWPHRFVRFMIAEQLYRAASILAGTPYHKA